MFCMTGLFHLLMMQGNFDGEIFFKFLRRELASPFTEPLFYHILANISDDG